MVRANKRLVGVTQNIESVITAMSGLEAMYDQIETLSGKSKAQVTTGIKNSLRDALEPTIEKYREVVENKIHNEAQVAGRSYGSDSVLRHLYAGGHPNNMGDEAYALFSVNYKKISQSKGWGFETYISTRVDNAASFSSITGSDKSIEVQPDGSLDWGPEYAPWRERAAMVYSGAVVSGARKRKWYIRAADPPTDYVAGGVPPQKIAAAPTFTKNYSQHAAYFKKWWEKELAVSGFELVGAYDRSQKTAMIETFNTLRKEAEKKNASAGLAQAEARVAGRTVSPIYKQEMSGDYIQKGDQKTATKIARVFYRNLDKQLQRHVGSLGSIPDTPSPPVQDEEESMGVDEYQPTGSFDDFLAGYQATGDDDW